MNKLSKDELFILALQLDLPDLLRFCKTSKIFDEKLCKNIDFWRYKIRNEFIDFNYEELISELETLSSQELYILLHTKKMWKMYESINKIWVMEEINGKNISNIPENLNLPNLRRLYLNNNKILNIPVNLNLPNLERLYLNNNSITDIPENLNLPNLKEFFLENNYVTSIPENLNLPKLRILLLE
jgi:Leucine-rich repeat (LRR) protein